MRPALQHAVRLLTDPTAVNLTTAWPSPIGRPAATPSLCLQCKCRAFSAAPPRRRKKTLVSSLLAPGRHWSSGPRLLQDGPIPGVQPSRPAPHPDEPASTRGPSSPAPQSDGVEQVPDENLPSHRQGLRWEIYRRASAYFDELLPKLVLVGQMVNTYTGTDYSGIEALRQEIKQQERLVQARRQRVEEAKRQLDASQSQRQVSQKEVVGLLERKSSWSAADLERYMSLVRSEHINDQAVRTAKDAVLSADRALEDARARLEKRERAQYHEEQIWSDTIRRNSTWVTIGLMGVNILLLLSQLIAIEPWRRRRLVREIKTALDQRTIAPGLGVGTQHDAVSVAESTGTPDADVICPPGPVQKEISGAVQPADAPLGSSVPMTATDDAPDQTPATPLSLVSKDQPIPAAARSRLTAFTKDCDYYLRDLFSERAISIRKVDVTTAALQAAAAGGTLVGFVMLALLRTSGSR